MKNNDTSLIHKKCYQFSLDTIKFSQELPNNRIAWVIINQLIRSATSIGANITEAKAASSRKDFIKFYQIALKSANETEYWLTILKDSKLCSCDDDIDKLISDIIGICNILGKSLLTMKGKT